MQQLVLMRTHVIDLKGVSDENQEGSRATLSL